MCCVQLALGPESLHWTAARKVAGPVLRWREMVAPTSRARTRGPGFGCVQRRTGGGGVSLPASSAGAALTGCRRGCPREGSAPAEPGPPHPQRRSPDSRAANGVGSAGPRDPPRPRSRPTFSEETTACVRPQTPAAGRTLPAEFGPLWAPWRRRQGWPSSRSSEVGMGGLRGGAEGAGLVLRTTPRTRGRSGRKALWGRPGGTRLGRMIEAATFPRGPRDPHSWQEGRPTPGAALWLFAHPRGGLPAPFYR